MSDITLKQWLLMPLVWLACPAYLLLVRLPGWILAALWFGVRWLFCRCHKCGAVMELDRPKHILPAKFHVMGNDNWYLFPEWQCPRCDWQ